MMWAGASPEKHATQTHGVQGLAGVCRYTVKCWLSSVKDDRLVPICSFPTACISSCSAIHGCFIKIVGVWGSFRVRLQCWRTAVQ